jgi:hypothetical protein
MVNKLFKFNYINFVSNIIDKSSSFLFGNLLTTLTSFRILQMSENNYIRAGDGLFAIFDESGTGQDCRKRAFSASLVRPLPASPTRGRRIGKILNIGTEKKK